MRNVIKKTFASVLALSLMIPAGTAAADNEEEIAAENTAGAEDGSDDSGEEDNTPDAVDADFVERTQEEALSTMELVAENESYEFYACMEVSDEAQEKGVSPKEKGNLFALKNKSTGYIWWSSPINAMGDPNATNSLRRTLSSAVIITYGIPSDRTTKTLRSANKASIRLTQVDGGVKAVYNFKDAGAKIPIEFRLCDDYLKVTVDTENIEESDINPSTGKVLTSISVFNAMGAAFNDEDGYFVVPDGSGAVINFNNNKLSSKSYAAKVYGADISYVPETRPASSEQVYLPVYGIVKSGKNALAAVAVSGDANATLRASVSGQSKCGYNLCGYDFMLRGTESYIMNGEQNAFTVFESGKIKTDNIEMRYYPISGNDVGYTDIALKYRDFLEQEKGVSGSITDPALYLNFYGGVEKKRSVLGFPVTMKTSITSFENAKDILSGVKNGGADNIVVTYDNWTSAGIAGKVDYKAKPSGTLGGKSDFRDLQDFAEENGFALYPNVNNKGFVSGQGYFTFTGTNSTVSGSYSRLIEYDRAYGVQSTFRDPVSLLSPSKFDKVYGDLSENYSKKGIKGVCLGEMTSSLYGDYGKDAMSRDMTKAVLEENYGKIKNTVGSILADTANAYAVGYSDHIKDVPLSSSGYDVFDGDIPFYQIVMHGLKPYSTRAVNSSPDYKTLMLKAIAAGSALSYDMLYEETSELKDTEYDIYFYANYQYWEEAAALGYKLCRDVLSDVSDQRIVGYEENGDVIKTTYENGSVITVNTESGEITANGKTYLLSDYLEKGGAAD